MPNLQRGWGWGCEEVEGGSWAIAEPKLPNFRQSISVVKNERLWGGLLSQFLPFRYFPSFSASSKYILAIEYDVHIWQLSPAKYGCDAKNLEGAFTGSNILLMEELTNGTLVTADPGHEESTNGRNYDEIRHCVLLESVRITSKKN